MRSAKRRGRRLCPATRWGPSHRLRRRLWACPCPMRRTADPAPPVVAAGRKPSRDKWLEIPSLRYIPNGIRHLRRYGLLAPASRIIPPLRSYRAWIRGYDTLRARDIAAIRQRIASMRERPLISVLLPVSGPPGPLLR